MDSYRINRYNITSQNISYTNRLVQGALRYQKLNLSSARELELSFVGLKSSTATSVKTPRSALPGSFNCSDPVLNRIWEMGARTMQLNEFSAESLRNSGLLPRTKLLLSIAWLPSHGLLLITPPC